mgnify:CR=1 FL=1
MIREEVDDQIAIEKYRDIHPYIYISIECMVVYVCTLLHEYLDWGDFFNILHKRIDVHMQQYLTSERRYVNIKENVHVKECTSHNGTSIDAIEEK